MGTREQFENALSTARGELAKWSPGGEQEHEYPTGDDIQNLMTKTGFRKHGMLTGKTNLTEDEYQLALSFATEVNNMLEERERNLKEATTPNSAFSPEARKSIAAEQKPKTEALKSARKAMNERLEILKNRSNSEDFNVPAQETLEYEGARDSINREIKKLSDKETMLAAKDWTRDSFEAQLRTSQNELAKWSTGSKEAYADLTPTKDLVNQLLTKRGFLKHGHLSGGNFLTDGEHQKAKDFTNEVEKMVADRRKDLGAEPATTMSPTQKSEWKAKDDMLKGAESAVAERKRVIANRDNSQLEPHVVEEITRRAEIETGKRKLAELRPAPQVTPSVEKVRRPTGNDPNINGTTSPKASTQPPTTAQGATTQHQSRTQAKRDTIKGPRKPTSEGMRGRRAGQKFEHPGTSPPVAGPDSKPPSLKWPSERQEPGDTQQSTESAQEQQIRNLTDMLDRLTKEVAEARAENAKLRADLSIMKPAAPAPEPKQARAPKPAPPTPAPEPAPAPAPTSPNTRTPAAKDLSQWKPEGGLGAVDEMKQAITKYEANTNTKLGNELKDYLKYFAGKSQWENLADPLDRREKKHKALVAALSDPSTKIDKVKEIAESYNGTPGSGHSPHAAKANKIDKINAQEDSGAKKGRRKSI